MGISKGKINQAGCYLSGKISKVSKDEANDLLNHFRSIHQHPMALFRHLIDRKLNKLKIKALVSQRLKRRPSIIQKLKKQDKMQLSRMQDIGGLRIVVDTINEVNLITDEIRKVEKHGGFRFTSANGKNYIENIAPSGYRSIHLIYKYDKNIPTEKQCRVEIQIRTKLQHSWATAVEVVGTYLNQPLKQSLGSNKYLDIFKDVGKLFQELETGKIEYESIQKVKQDIERIELLNKLRSVDIVADYIGNTTKGQYILLKMDFKQQIVEIVQYGKAKFEQANKDYLKMEMDNSSNRAVEVVLISIQDIRKLQQSYPNYFMDTTEFFKNLDKLFESAERMQELKNMMNNSKSEKGKIALNKMFDNIFKETLELF
ncbi:RelA/SpoT domain protein [uncultured Candidatus Thioglobus sp.]|nr:RelA/SpoT domain protein [uncultured Candidatus Thioglobus sp.]